MHIMCHMHVVLARRGAMQGDIRNGSMTMGAQPRPTCGVRSPPRQGPQTRRWIFQGRATARPHGTAKERKRNWAQVGRSGGRHKSMHPCSGRRRRV